MQGDGRRLDLPRDDDLVPLTSARTEIEAEILSERLRNRGVHCLLRIEDDLRASTSALGLMTWAYSISVLESDIERGRAILDEIGHAEPEAEQSSHRIEIIAGSLLTVALSLLLALVLLARSR